jgi:hypothetical protein
MWVLSAFEKDGDWMVEQLPLRGVDVDALRQLFHQPSDDPMYYTYPVSSDIADALADYVEGRIDMGKYDYFLDYKADPSGTPA